MAARSKGLVVGPGKPEDLQLSFHEETGLALQLLAADNCCLCVGEIQQTLEFPHGTPSDMFAER